MQVRFGKISYEPPKKSKEIEHQVTLPVSLFLNPQQAQKLGGEEKYLYITGKDAKGLIKTVKELESEFQSSKNNPNPKKIKKAIVCGLGPTFNKIEKFIRKNPPHKAGK